MSVRKGVGSMGSNAPPPQSEVTLPLHENLESIRIYIRVRVARSRKFKSGNVLIITKIAHTNNPLPKVEINNIYLNDSNCFNA